jgi:hypothetical protein
MKYASTIVAAGVTIGCAGSNPTAVAAGEITFSSRVSICITFPTFTPLTDSPD